jgi:hypothetical protein
MPIFKRFLLKNLCSKALGQIQNLVPEPPDVPIEDPSPFQATLFELGHTPIESGPKRWIWMGAGGRREFGLRGQRRETGSDKGTAANSLSGRHAPGLKLIVTCLQRAQYVR